MRALNDVLMKMIDDNSSERIPTGFVELDKILKGGLDPDRVTMVAGRPSMGKTSFMTDVAMHFFATTGKKVAFFLFTEVEEEAALSILWKVYENKKGYQSIPTLESYRVKRLMDREGMSLAYNKVKDLPIFVHRDPNITSSEIKDMCAGIEDLGMIIVDSNCRFDMKEASTVYIDELSKIATDLHLPVICSCGVNRSVEFYDDCRPVYSSIFSGGLGVGTPEPTIIALYREDYYRLQDLEDVECTDSDYPAGCHPAEAIVIPFWGFEKGGGTAQLMWNEKRYRFEEEGEYECI